MIDRALRVCFFESGIGETIILEFPDGQIGIVDAYPSNTASRPDILQIIRDREIAFVCLTHPHEDHGLDLIRILENQQIKEFWYSFSPANKFVFHATQQKKFLSPERKWAEEIKLGWAKFMIDLLDPVARKRIYARSLNESSKSIEIAAVKIHFLAPSHRFITAEESRLDRCLKDPRQPAPDVNGFSLVIGLEYGASFVLLGADCLKPAWKGARDSWSKSRLPRALALKVPHHGAKNAFDLRPANQKPVNCWDLCANGVKAILFAGDSQHPDEAVRKRLEEKTDLISLFALDDVDGDLNPLRLTLAGVRLARKSPRKVQYSSVILEVGASGEFSLTKP